MSEYMPASRARPRGQITANLWPLGDRQTRADPDHDWLVDYEDLTLDECIRHAQQAARPYQVLSPAQMTMGADYQVRRLNVLVDRNGTVQRLWAG